MFGTEVGVFGLPLLLSLAGLLGRLADCSSFLMVVGGFLREFHTHPIPVTHLPVKPIGFGCLLSAVSFFAAVVAPVDAFLLMTECS